MKRKAGICDPAKASIARIKNHALSAVRRGKVKGVQLIVDVDPVSLL